MTDWNIEKSEVSGEINIPPSKSQTMRALIFALLAKGQSSIHRPLLSPDTSFLNQDSLSPAKIEIQGGIENLGREINVGGSGILLRFLTAICSHYPSPIRVFGDATLQNRPMSTLFNALDQLGANGACGPWTNSFATLDGSDSQPVSALLIASLLANRPTTIQVENPGEKPWIDLTLAWLDRFGVSYERDGYSKFIVQPKDIAPFEYTVPGDVSSASYPAAAALLSQKRIELQGIDPNDKQGDIAFFYILEKMGAKIAMNSDSIVVEPSSQLHGTSADLNRCIDAITMLPVIACFAASPTHIFGAQIARTKECDRIASITSELRKMGAQIEEREDGMTIFPSTLRSATVASHGDHRMALSLAVAGAQCNGKTQIRNVDCTTKTFPEFAQQMQALGMNIEEIA